MCRITVMRADNLLYLYLGIPGILSIHVPIREQLKTEKYVGTERIP